MIRKIEAGQKFPVFNFYCDLEGEIGSFKLKESVFNPFRTEVRGLFLSESVFQEEYESLDIYFIEEEDQLKNIPGKYLLKFLQFYLSKEKLIRQCDLDTFAFRLAAFINPETFKKFRQDVLSYLKK